MSTKHTRGPWQAINDDLGGDSDVVFIQAQPSPAMRGFTKRVAFVYGSEVDPQSTANAALIAAAPELLEAAKLARVVLQDAHALTIYGTEDPSVQKAFDAVLAAIAKAEGAS
ncbi:MAG: hypothetical protein AAFU68_02895 [Pseudomonadota bacterium]